MDYPSFILNHFSACILNILISPSFGLKKVHWLKYKRSDVTTKLVRLEEIFVFQAWQGYFKDRITIRKSSPVSRIQFIGNINGNSADNDFEKIVIIKF